MQTIFAWLLLGLVIISAYPLAAWLLSQSPREDGLWLTALLTLALSIGTLTLLMFWESLLGTAFTLWKIILPYFTIMAVGVWLWWKSPMVKAKSHSKRIFPGFGSLWRNHKIVFPVVIIATGILFNAAYWPFHQDDVLGIYGKYGKLMAETGTLVPFAGFDDAFYQAYPIQIPLVYTFTFLASGWENEYLARVIPALFSLACLPAVFVLGRMIYNQRAGEMAALLLVLTPTFVRWGSSGYVDLPMAFFYTLAAIFAWRFQESRHPVDAVLLGIASGLMAWTKNAALVGISFIFVWLIFSKTRDKGLQWRRILLTLGVCMLIAAPWYIRNWIEAGLIVPPTAWTEQARRTITNIAILITEPENFALTGWFIMGAVFIAIFQVIKKQSLPPRSSLLLFLTLPFFGMWWLLVSYDPRFLLLFLPLFTVLAGGWAAELEAKISPRLKKPISAIGGLLIIALAVYMLWISVEFKDEILHHPFMGDEAKKAIVLR